MKFLNGGFQHKKFDLHPEAATDYQKPYALVVPAGNVLLVEYGNGTKSAATYRSKETATNALHDAQSEFPGVKIWDRRHP